MKFHKQTMLPIVMAVLFSSGGMIGAKDISEHGNPWLWVTIGKAKVKTEVVRTPERVYLGLSYRRELPEGQGMLFCMPDISVQTFCMRGMVFPLDFIWIIDGRVAGITKNVPPTFPGNLPSPKPINYILEVNGGFADKYNIKEGDPVKW